MQIKTISSNELKKADEFQQKILNPENKARYRTFGYIKRNYLKNPSLFVGIYDNSHLAGLIFGYVKRENVLLGEMAIDKEYRNRGLGSKLLSFFEGQVLKINKKKIILGARENAERFYLKKGYKPILFLQIKNSDVPKNYKKLTNYRIIKETNYKDAKRISFEVKQVSDYLKNKLVKIFHAYDGIYLFEKNLKARAVPYPK
ncbi:GNAT family N-acetyltransferase [Candidatus Pacearchaeota archaeon]|nr:GNAT family N-acetyltransferase [Candidatus Pacearchaeota archaeon]